MVDIVAPKAADTRHAPLDREARVAQLLNPRSAPVPARQGAKVDSGRKREDESFDGAGGGGAAHGGGAVRAGSLPELGPGPRQGDGVDATELSRTGLYA
jgi:hypothetical protein